MMDVPEETLEKSRSIAEQRWESAQGYTDLPDGGCGARNVAGLRLDVDALGAACVNLSWPRADGPDLGHEEPEEPVVTPAEDDEARGGSGVDVLSIDALDTPILNERDDEDCEVQNAQGDDAVGSPNQPSDLP